MKHPILFVFAMMSLVSFQSCFLAEEDDDCTLTGAPVTNSTLNSGYDSNGNNHWIPTAVYKAPKGAELYYSLGSCGTDVSTDWEYTGDYDIITQEDRGAFSALFYTSGTLCGRFIGNGKATEQACQQIKVITDNVWTTAPDFPAEPSLNTVTLKINNRVYSGFGYTNVWYELDTADFSWKERAHITGLVDFAAYAGFTLNNKGYIVGANSKVYEYNQTADSWAVVGDFPVNVTDYLQFAVRPKGSYYNSILGVAANGKGYFGLGISTKLWEFDPATKTWTEKASYPVHNEDTNHIFVYNSRIYVGNYYFDISTNVWIKNSIDFDSENGFGANPVELDGIVYGAFSAKTMQTDGTSRTTYEPRPREPYEPLTPTNLTGNGVSLGNLIIYPRPSYHTSQYKLTPTSTVSIYRN